MNNRKYNQYDVTIAGAGPSGSILAYELAKKGLKVLLLEKYKIPRDKVCAGGVTVRAASLLPFDFSDLILDTIYGVRLSYKMIPHRVRTYDKPLAYMVARDQFDALLASKAREAGAAVEDDIEVKDVQLNRGHVLVKTNTDSFSTPLLVGADGANSRVVHALGIRAGFEYGLGVNGDIPVNSEVYSRWDGLFGLDYGIPGGYAWVFPKGDYLAVGAGSSFRVSKRLRPYTLQLTRSYQLGTVNGDAIKGHLMPLKRASTRLVHDRVLLVGDAAGVIDPLSGEGMFYGIKSSYLAANSIVKFLEGKIPDLSEYDDNVNRELMPELRIARTIQKMNSATPWIFLYFLEHNDRWWRAFCRMLRGERTYQSLKNRLPFPIRPIFRIF
jgi:geranylgeranyl reductase family protein